MGIEIERKFLVKSDGWRKLGCAVRYAQGYPVSYTHLRAHETA